MTGMSEALLILWISTGRFEPSIEMELKNPFSGEDLLGFNRYVLTEDDVKRLRKLAESSSKAEEDHKAGTNWTIKQLAEAWGLSTDLIRDTFKKEPGILKIERPAVKGKNPKRAYTTFTIPEAVAERVRRRISS